MAIDIDQVLEDAINAPSSMTNAAGETVSSRSAADLIILIDRARSRTARRPPLVTLAVMPGMVGPQRTTDAE